jgi:hypothetical protein
MRVNWATNLLPGYYGQATDLNTILAWLERRSAD